MTCCNEGADRRLDHRYFKVFGNPNGNNLTHCGVAMIGYGHDGEKYHIGAAFCKPDFPFVKKDLREECDDALFNKNGVHFEIKYNNSDRKWFKRLKLDIFSKLIELIENDPDLYWVEDILTGRTIDFVITKGSIKFDPDTNEWVIPREYIDDPNPKYMDYVTYIDSHPELEIEHFPILVGDNDEELMYAHGGVISIVVNTKTNKWIPIFCSPKDTFDNDVFINLALERINNEDFNFNLTFEDNIFNLTYIQMLRGDILNYKSVPNWAVNEICGMNIGFYELPKSIVDMYLTDDIIDYESEATREVYRIPKGLISPR